MPPACHRARHKDATGGSCHCSAAACPAIQPPGQDPRPPAASQASTGATRGTRAFKGAHGNPVTHKVSGIALYGKIFATGKLFTLDIYRIRVEYTQIQAGGLGRCDRMLVNG
jgi:hypothetical protein